MRKQQPAMCHYVAMSHNNIVPEPVELENKTKILFTTAFFFFNFTFQSCQVYASFVTNPSATGKMVNLQNLCM